MRNFVYIFIAILLAFVSVSAFAQDGKDSIAVMRLDSEGEVDSALKSALLDAIKTEVLNSDRAIDKQGGDVSYLEMQILTDCDRAASLACYEAATDMLGANQLISGTMKEGGETSLVWYKTGVGVFRRVNASVLNADDANKLAKRLLIGEMGSLTVTSNVPGAGVYIDGKRVGMTAEIVENAQKISLLAGSYIVAVRMDGYDAEDAKKIEIVGDQDANANFTLSVMLDQGKMQRVFKYTGWALLGTGAASLVTSAALFGVMTNANGEMNKCIKPGGGLVGTECNKKILGERDVSKIDTAGKKLETAYMVTLGVGAGLAAIGTAMVLVGYFYDFGSEEAIVGMPKIDLALTPEYQGLGLSWKF